MLIDKILYYVKIIAIIQVVVIVLSLFILYLTKIILYFRNKKLIKTQLKIEQLLPALVRDQVELTPNAATFLRCWIFLVLKTLHRYEQNTDTRLAFNKLLVMLKADVLLPVAAKLSESRRWFKRYTATLCYIYAFNEQCEKQVLKLIFDNILMVSINAAMIAVRYSNEKLINAMIDVFSDRRRIQQVICAEIIMQENNDISAILFARLVTEQDVYKKVFCYRLLLEVPSKDIMYPDVQQDLENKNIDLKIAALRYLAQLQTEFKAKLIQSLALDADWEVRAVVARLMGDFIDTKNVELLELMLTDKNFVVRVNAANSLLQEGDKGIAALLSQTPNRDKYAYEAAQQVLLAAKII